MNVVARVAGTVGRWAEPRRSAGILVSLAALGLVTGAIYVFKYFVPVLSLGVLYLFAVLPVAVLFGRAYAVAVALASAGLFNFLFLPPLYTLRLTDGENWFALAVYLVVGIVASDLAVRARQRAAEAEQREREEALLAQMATAFLQAESAVGELEGFAPAIADVLHAADARIVLGPQKEPPQGESPLELTAGGRRLGTLYLHEGPDSSLAIRRRFLPALASLLAVAIDRERLAREALEAEALRRSDTIKTAVLRAVSHDLRSPLTAITVAAESLGSTGARARRGRPGRAPRHGAARGRPARAARRQPARPLASPGRRGRAEARALRRRRALAQALDAARRPPSRVALALPDERRRRRGRREPDPARRSSTCSRTRSSSRRPDETVHVRVDGDAQRR